MLILDEPTRGVDIGAKSEIYRIIDELAQKGVGVIVISSELPEIIGICDRVLVMREGQIEGEVGGTGGAADHPGEHHGARDRRQRPERRVKSADQDGRRQSMNAMKTTGGDARLPDDAAAKAAARQVQIRTIIQAVGMLPVLILICIGFEFADRPVLDRPQNISIVAQQASINTVLAAGMTFVILTGGIDLSVGSILAASAAWRPCPCSLIPAGGCSASRRPCWSAWCFGFLNGSADRVLPPAALHRHPGLADGGARLRPADRRRHHGVQPDLPFAFIGNCPHRSASPGWS